MAIESTGYPHSKRIVDGTGHLVAMAEQYTSGLWAVHDKETGKKLCPEQHKTAKAAAVWFFEAMETD